MTTEQINSSWNNLTEWVEGHNVLAGFITMFVALWVLLPLVILTWFNIFTVTFMATCLALIIASFILWDM